RDPLVTGVQTCALPILVQRLDAEGLLKYEKYRGLLLTAAGKKLARRIAQRHKLLTEFLRLLGVDDRVIHHDVEGMEHHISPSTRSEERRVGKTVKFGAR